MGARNVSDPSPTPSNEAQRRANAIVEFARSQGVDLAVICIRIPGAEPNSAIALAGDTKLALDFFSSSYWATCTAMSKGKRH